MANLKVNNYHNLKLRINGDEYWDFFVNKDSYGSYKIPHGLYEDCLVSYIDLSDEECIGQDNWIYGKSGYTWVDSIAVEDTLHNISYVGLDNGLFTFRKDRISNKDFPKIFQENTFNINADDFRLKLHAVSGNTLQYEYPLHIEEKHVKLNGGFFQGFFKTECGKYQILPTHLEEGDTVNFEFTLNRCDLEKESDKTLNDKYPENKGIFFYIGTRAENKWIYLYDKDDEDGLEDCFELGLDDFVEDGEIDKKDYIIGNFYDPMIDFQEDPPLDYDNYTDFRYYDEIGDYIDMSSWCCNNDNEYEEETVLAPFFNGCGCQTSYKKKKAKKVKDNNDFLSGCIPFGEYDYIGDFDNLEEADTEYTEQELDISDFEYETDNGFNLGEANWSYFYTDNKFMFFDRTKTGKTVSNWVEGTEFMFASRKSNFKGNLFILMNRTKTGYTVSNIDKLRDETANEYDPYSDIYDNALAFRITDDGEIGYRLLTKDCTKEGRDKSMIMEGYSFKNVIPSCEWVTINIRMSYVFGKMKFMFYVNGKLVYITKELPMINLRKLNELYEKQEGVPYNISIGGGTQGLAETIQYNYMLNPTRVYPLEKYFAGTFIGYISSFKIYNCFMEKNIIENNYKYENNKN